VKFGWRQELLAIKPEREFARLKLDTRNLPTEFSLLGAVDEVSVFDQGNTGSCVAQATSGAARVVSAVRLPPDTPNVRLDDMPTPSRRWLYNQACATHSESHLDDGTFISAVLFVGRTLGWPDERTAMGWDQFIASNSNDAERTMWVTQKPTADDRRHAHDQRDALEEYAITTRGDALELDLRAALYRERAPVLCGGIVTWAFTRLGHDWTPFRFGDDDAGGHAMVIVGYDAQSYHLLNSWGGSWGVGGLCRIHRWDVRQRLRDFHAVTGCKGATS
jgi:hypothetical protein